MKISLFFVAYVKTYAYLYTCNQLKKLIMEIQIETKKLTNDELNGLKSLIDYVISKRVNDDASSLSYMELLNLKNKL